MVRRAVIQFMVFLVIMNAVAVVSCHGSARNIGPVCIVVNVMVLLLGLACMDDVKHNSGGANLGPYLLAVLCGPQLALAVDFVVAQAWLFGVESIPRLWRN